MLFIFVSFLNGRGPFDTIIYMALLAWLSVAPHINQTLILLYRLALQSEGSPNRYRGMFHAFRTIIQEEGARALYKGWLPSVIGVVYHYDPF